MRLSPQNKKKADVIPVFKKKERNNVENYRPVSILANFSKIYERCLYDQMYNISIIYAQNGTVDSVKTLAYSTVFL